MTLVLEPEEGLSTRGQQFPVRREPLSFLAAGVSFCSSVTTLLMIFSKDLRNTHKGIIDTTWRKASMISACCSTAVEPVMSAETHSVCYRDDASEFTHTSIFLNQTGIIFSK